MGFLSAGDGIPMSDCFIRWFWAGFAADAAPSHRRESNYIIKLRYYIRREGKEIGGKGYILLTWLLS